MTRAKFCGILAMLNGTKEQMKNRLYINDAINTKFGLARIRSIDLYEIHAPVGDPIALKSVWSNLRDRCVFDLDNDHWVYGYQIEDL